MILKIITLICLSAMMRFASHELSSKPNLSTRADTTDLIQQIKEQYKIVNTNQSLYRLIEKDLMDESTEGGSVTGLDDRQLYKKLIVTYFGEMGKKVTEYYFKNNDLFFTYTKEYFYDKPIDVSGSKIDYVLEDRCYFNNKKMIKWLHKGNFKKTDEAASNKIASTLLSDSKRFFALAYNCKNLPLKALSHDTVRCKNGVDCPSTGYILKGSRNICGEAIHVSPKNKKVPLE